MGLINFIDSHRKFNFLQKRFMLTNIFMIIMFLFSYAIYGSMSFKFLYYFNVFFYISAFWVMYKQYKNNEFIRQSIAYDIYKASKRHLLLINFIVIINMQLFPIFPEFYLAASLCYLFLIIIFFINQVKTLNNSLKFMSIIMIYILVIDCMSYVCRHIPQLLTKSEEFGTIYFYKLFLIELFILIITVGFVIPIKHKINSMKVKFTHIFMIYYSIFIILLSKSFNIINIQHDMIMTLINFISISLILIIVYIYFENKIFMNREFFNYIKGGGE